MKMIKRILIFTTALIVLSAMDVVSTILVLRAGGIELNQFAVQQWESLGFMQTALVKIGFCFTFGFFALVFNAVAEHRKEFVWLRRGQRIFTVLFVGLLSWHTFVLANNLVVLMVLIS